MKAPALIASLVLFSVAATTASAAPIITLGTYALLPNTANQTISVLVSGGAVGGAAVQGINLFAQSGDGGTAVGGTAGPTITAVNLKPVGGVFGGIADAAVDGGSVPQVAIRSLAYLTGGSGATVTIPATPTLLATLTFSTVGLTSGTYDLRLANVLPAIGPYNTDFAGVAASITNGTLTIVALPEPTTLAAVAGVAIVALRRRRTA